MVLICPLLSIGAEKKAECLGKECAWLIGQENPKREFCAIMGLAASVRGISTNVSKMAFRA